MRIFSPLNNGFDIKKLSEVCDEFYVGVIDEEWSAKYNGFIGYNTRAFSGTQANFPNWSSLEDAIKAASEYKCPTFLTLNAHNITQSQLSIVKSIISDFSKIGGAGIICSELNGVELAKEAGLKVYLSTNFVLYNLNAIKYLIRTYNVDRIILSRDMKFDEIKKIRWEIDREIEVFGQNVGCRFSNGLCYCTHNTKSKGMCYTSSTSEWEHFGSMSKLTFREKYDADINHHIYSKYLLRNSCSLCAIYDFVKVGIDSIKVVGREFPCNVIFDSCSMLKRGVSAAQKSDSREEYLEWLSCNKKNLINFDCDWGFQCYYPEMGYKNFKKESIE